MKSTLLSCFLVLLGVGTVRADQSAEDILNACGVQGGLIVHVGCGDAELTAQLQASDAFIVQGLDKDPAKVQQAREFLKTQGCKGAVSVDAFDGSRLPYVDELVNLLVVSEAFDVDRGEMMRVLSPGGVAYVKTELGNESIWRKIVKPWPDDIDEWTHYLYNAEGTSVSTDRVAGYPKGLRWTGGPFWARSHEHTASMQAMVSAGGRVFYVMDEGPTDSIQLPAKMMLVARDAFNGTVLWKHPLKDWFNPLYPLKSGPGWLPRRLVAVGDRVFIAPGLGQNLLSFDAATGEVACEYDNTASTFELIVSEGVVFAAVDPNQEACDYNQQNPDCWKERDRASAIWQWDREQDVRVIKAMDAATGRAIWQAEAPVAPMTLAADAQRVCFYDGSSIVALDRKTGKSLWTSDVIDISQFRTGVAGPRLIISGDKVLLSPAGSITAVSAETGELLWGVNNKPRSGHYSLEDFYVIKNRVWALQRGNNGAFSTYSLSDGKPLEEHSNPIRSFYIHQRCYPGRATERLLLPPIMGIMVYDMEQDAWSNNHWVRGGCIYGVMPANGMVYATPHACACYYQSKLNGFNALAPESQPSEAPAADLRLTKGSAYGKTDRPAAEPTSDEASADWPTFRHDAKRSGFVATDVSAQVGKNWTKDFGTKLSQPVVADGRLLLSAIDQHAVYALDAASGDELWHFVAGGRVNSPPALYAGLAIFGCADGYVYALDAETGQVAWRFSAAPNDRKLISYGQVESVWPLAGSVLLQDGKVYCVAGRSMFLDGGLRMIILDPLTGELLSENVMDRLVPGGDQKLDDLLMGKHMPVAMPDILSGDGQYVYMKSQTFTPDGKRVRIAPQRPDEQYDREVHLFSPISFLDDGWHQRTYWILGRAAGEGWAEFQFPPKRVPCGRILCFDDQNAFGYARDPELYCNTSVSEYRLYSAGKYPSRKVGIPKLEGTWIKSNYPTENPLASNSVNWKQLSTLPSDKLSALDYNWIDEEPEVMAKAMVLANDQLFVAGPRDVVDEKQMWGHSNEPEFQRKMAEQAAWLEGKNGGCLQVFSKADGAKVAELDLDHLPAFDGMIAAGGRLFMVTQDGSLVCYK